MKHLELLKSFTLDACHLYISIMDNEFKDKAPRQRILRLWALSLIAMVASLPVFADQDPLIVQTLYGSVSGKKDSADTYSWKGIPYATPPIGDLRWKAPRPPEHWQEVRKASEFGNKAAQVLPVLNWTIGNEDCLYLNVWRPADDRSKLPVYFWIHGGGNTMGSASSSDYHGHALASRAGVVFVSVSYRLGPFGWFSHPGLTTGYPEDDSGNYGTLDLIAALEWVRDNISAFGGDPENVTIAGESAGAFNVLTLLLAPKARGLFHKAVVQSGYRTDSTPEMMRAFAVGLSERLTIPLRDASTAAILKGISPSMAGMLDMPYPNWDGTVLPSDGYAAFADPSRVADVPIIIGTNKEETKLFQWLGRTDSHDPLYQARAELSSARWKAEGADSVADALTRGNPNRRVYLYRFDWGAPDVSGKSVLGGRAGTKIGASHGLEISFFLQTDSMYGNALPLPIRTKANEAGRKALQAMMGTYLEAFLKEGNPNAENLPEWEPWSAASDAPPFMVFDANLSTPTSRIDYGRTTIESTKAAFTAYSDPLKARLKEILRWE